MARKLLFITDDRESYARGNYYLAYQRAFMRHADVTLAHPLEPWPDPRRFALVILGHASVEHLGRMKGSRFLPSRLRNRLWFRHANLRALRRSRTPAVLFTKNDYKAFDRKNGLIEYLRPRLVITHTRSALEKLVAPRATRMTWMPFGVDSVQFTPGDGARPFAVGFRANANSEWNAGEREQFFRALRRLEGKHAVSLTLSKKGEGFLVGQPYVDWLRSCALLGNTVSAAGTVGPRFLEAIACGSVPLAPRQAYEGLLEPDRHYVPVDAGDDGSFSRLEDAVARYLGDATYRTRLLDEGRALVEQHNVDQHVIQVCRDLGV